MILTAVILTKNEEKNIEKCLKSLSWCDEILVVDDNSTDKTKELVRKYKATLLERNLEGDFSQQRNFALQHAKGEWVLFVDADEVVSPEFAFEIQGKIVSGAVQGWYMKRLDSMWGKKLLHGETGNIQLMRLGKRDGGLWEGNVHETWKIKGKTGVLSHPLYHYPHQSLTQFLQEINFYTTLRAEELHKKNIKVSWVQIITYPKAKFFVNYFLKQGFRDGLEGLVFALLMSLHSFLVRAKLWHMNHQDK